jgi:hypothetical protein
VKRWLVEIYTMAVFSARLVRVFGQDFGSDRSGGGDGDGVGGDYVFIGDPATNKLFRLFGDGNGSGNVDLTDFGLFRATFGNNNTVFDSDNNGDVDASDFGAFRARFSVAI